MDQTFIPANASWQVLVDSTPTAVTSQAWAGPEQLDLTLINGPAPSVDVTLELLVQDPALHSDHLIPVLPFGPTVVSAG